MPDSCDIARGAADIDSNGVPDSCQADCNANTIPDTYEFAQGTAVDCNINGVLDSCDIASGTIDTNLDGIPDECQCITDFNLDGVTSGADLAVILSFWGPVGGFQGADLNGDDIVNAADLAILLSNWGPCQ